MVGIPAHCRSCGAIFQSRAFHMENAWNVVLQGNKETCPRCGQLADIVDGTFNVTNQVLQLLSGPEFTKEIIQQFSELVRQAAANDLSQEALQAQAQAISPELGDMVERAQSKYGGMAAVLLFLALFALQNCQVNLNVNVDIDANELWEQMVRKSQSEIVLEVPHSKR